jgi:hypothetical protein
VYVSFIQALTILVRYFEEELLGATQSHHRESRSHSFDLLIKLTRAEPHCSSALFAAILHGLQSPKYDTRLRFVSTATNCLTSLRLLLLVSNRISVSVVISALEQVQHLVVLYPDSAQDMIHCVFEAAMRTFSHSRTAIHKLMQILHIS